MAASLSLHVTPSGRQLTTPTGGRSSSLQRSPACPQDARRLTAIGETCPIRLIATSRQQGERKIKGSLEYAVACSSARPPGFTAARSAHLSHADY